LKTGKKIDKNNSVWNNHINLLPFMQDDGPLGRGIVLPNES